MSNSVNSGMICTPQQMEQYQQLMQKRYENHIKQKKQEYAVKNAALYTTAGAVIGAGSTLISDILPNGKSYTLGTKLSKMGKSAAIMGASFLSFHVVFSLLQKAFFRNE